MQLGINTMTNESRVTCKLKKANISLAMQDIGLTVMAYGLFAAFAADVISSWVFCLGFFIYTFRSFNIRHERAHVAQSASRRTSWLEVFSEYFQVFYLPYHEPYSGKRWKHLAHHKFHIAKDGQHGSSLVNDPHRIFEQGSPLKAFLMSFLYEEVNLYFDIRDRGISRERIMMTICGVVAIASTIYLAGMDKFLMLAICYRLSLTIAWFTFSYVMHIPAVYENQIGDVIPSIGLRICDLILGHGMATAVFYHSKHHMRPQEYVSIH